MKKILRKLIALSVFGIFASPGFASVITPGLEFDSVTEYFPDDESYTLGYVFRADSAVTVNSLGAFDADGGNGFLVAHEVGLWDITGSTLLGSVSLGAGSSGTLVGHFRYAVLNTAITLVAGNSYVVGASNYGINEAYGYNAVNQTTVAGLTWIDDALDHYAGNPPGVTSLTFPGLAQNNQGGGGWYGGTVGVGGQISIPEPATLALFGLGLLGFSFKKLKLI